MKKFFTIVLVVTLCLLTSCTQKKAKYVFYFIGDGMGLSHRTTAEMYQSALEGEIGQKRLVMNTLPVQGLATTYSANSYVTCSAAAGTALATGVKTKNGMLGMSPDTVALTSIATTLKAEGKAIGIITSIMLNHATPAAFYAHQPNRNDYAAIYEWLQQSDFDYFAGGRCCDDQVKSIEDDELLRNAGFFVATNREEMNQMCREQKKWVLFGDDLDETTGSVNFVIDRKENAIDLADMLQKAIDLLTPEKEGFFIMIEGAKIDIAAHDNDAATVVSEILELDEAVALAYEFYQKHPDETLIVVTSDHETGGLSNGNKAMKYKMLPELLAHQKHSYHYLVTDCDSLLQQIKTEADVFEYAKAVGLDHPELLKNQKDSTEILEAYHTMLTTHSESALPSAIIKVLNRNVGIGWTTGKHSGTPVLVSAVGVRAEQFEGIIDNTDIPKMILQIAKGEQ